MAASVANKVYFREWNCISVIKLSQNWSCKHSMVPTCRRYIMTSLQKKKQEKSSNLGHILSRQN